MAPQPNNGRTVRVDPEALIDKGKKLAELPGLPNGLFEILTKLNNNLLSLGQPWGSDKMGKQFAEGEQGYLKSKDALVGNASTGSDAKGAVPVYGQLLVNYGRTIEEAGKVFGRGDDLFAEWILKNYVDEDASGDPGPYTGPLSSDPNRNKEDKDGQNDGKNGPTGPPPPPGGNQGSGGGPEIKSGGGPGPGALGTGPGPGGSTAGGPNIGDVTGPPVANMSSTGMTGPNSPYTPGPGPGPGQGNSKDLPGGISPNAKNFGLDSGLGGGVPGVLGPNAYKPAIDPVTGAPVDKSGSQGAGGKGGGPGGPLGNPMLRSTSAFDGEKLAGKNGQGGPQTRAGVPGTGIPPGMPGGMPPGSQGGASGDGKEKRRDRRKTSPQVDEPSETPDPGDPWQRSGWRTGDR